MHCRQWRFANIAKLSPTAGVQIVTMPSSSFTASAAPLDYAPAPRNRRRIYRAIVASLLLGLSLVAWKRGPGWWRRAEIFYWQHQCLQYSLPPDTVVYEEDPTCMRVPQKAHTFVYQPEMD